jgi:hypothetical protein
MSVSAVSQENRRSNERRIEPRDVRPSAGRQPVGYYFSAAAFAERVIFAREGIYVALYEPACSP